MLSLPGLTLHDASWCLFYSDLHVFVDSSVVLDAFVLALFVRDLNPEILVSKIRVQITTCSFDSMYVFSVLLLLLLMRRSRFVHDLMVATHMLIFGFLACTTRVRVLRASIVLIHM